MQADVSVDAVATGNAFSATPSCSNRIGPAMTCFCVAFATAPPFIAGGSRSPPQRHPSRTALHPTPRPRRTTATLRSRRSRRIWAIWFAARCLERRSQGGTEGLRADEIATRPVRQPGKMSLAFAATRVSAAPRACARPAVAARAARTTGTWFPGSEAPKHLDGSLPADYGFDPLKLVRAARPLGARRGSPRASFALQRHARSPKGASWHHCAASLSPECGRAKGLATRPARATCAIARVRGIAAARRKRQPARSRGRQFLWQRLDMARPCERRTPLALGRALRVVLSGCVGAGEAAQHLLRIESSRSTVSSSVLRTSHFDPASAQAGGAHRRYDSRLAVQRGPASRRHLWHFCCWF